MKDQRKTFSKLLHKAVFILSDASAQLPHFPGNETAHWHLDEAVTHIVAALDQCEELIKQEEKEAHQ